jgi:nuclear pore complex protein Nup85
LAVSFCTSAEDWPGLGRVVNRVLEEYITGGKVSNLFVVSPICDEALQGPATFSEHASAIAPSIQDIRDQPKSQGIFVHRLMFVVRYAHFHQLLKGQELQDAASDLTAMFHDDLVPKSWWAVLLCDSIQLLQYSMCVVVLCALLDYVLL